MKYIKIIEMHSCTSCCDHEISLVTVLWYYGNYSKNLHFSNSVDLTEGWHKEKYQNNHNTPQKITETSLFLSGHWSTEK